MCQDQGRGGTGICQRSVSALGMNLISVIRFKSTTKTGSLRKVRVFFFQHGLSEPVQKPGTNSGQQRETISNLWRRLLLCTFLLVPITTCRLAHKRIFLQHLRALRSSQTCFAVDLFISPVDYSSYRVQFNKTWAIRTPPFKKKKKTHKVLQDKQMLSVAATFTYTDRHFKLKISISFGCRDIWRFENHGYTLCLFIGT